MYMYLCIYIIFIHTCIYIYIYIYIYILQLLEHFQVYNNTFMCVQLRCLVSDKDSLPQSSVGIVRQNVIFLTRHRHM